MTHSQGFRCKTRKVFARAFREHGRVHDKQFSHIYHRGDYVTVYVNSGVHKGMPHRYYHGKNGRVFDVNPRSIGVEVPKRVGVRIMLKRIYVRVEHLKPSNCHDNHVARVQANDEARRNAKGDKAVLMTLKRQPEAPRAEMIVEAPKIVDIAPEPFHGIYV